MPDSPIPFSRRRFLSDLAVLGLTPFASLDAAVGWFGQEQQFAGDDLERAHSLFLSGGDPRARGDVTAHPDRLDVIVVGGGIAGLAAAYTLRQRRIVLFEGSAEPGGVSKSERWNGLEYALGAAYIIDPDPDSDDERERRGFELLESLGLRARGEDLLKDRTKGRRLGGEANHCVFTKARVLGPREVYSPRADAFFRHVLDSDRYPSVPPSDADLVGSLDPMTFAEFVKNAGAQRQLYGRTIGPVSRTGWEAIEYYFWGAFGASASETSAYHGLNFFAAEYGDLLIFPGGNGYITRRLADRLTAHNPGIIRTSSWVLDIEPVPGSGYAVTVHENGRLHRYQTRTVIFAAPLLMAPRLIRSLPDAQRTAIRGLEYRAYVVANLLLGRRIDQIFKHAAFRNGYELTPVHGVDLGASPAPTLARRHVFSDAIVADFPAWRDPKAAVLTVYRPYPFAGGRAEVMATSYADMDAGIRRAVLDVLGAHGLQPQDILASRIARWGHAMILPRPGQLVNDTLARASASLPGLWFAHTDVQGAPAYENALAAAFEAADAAGVYLDGKSVNSQRPTPKRSGSRERGDNSQLPTPNSQTEPLETTG